MDKFCHSCSAPLSRPEFQGNAENYCKYCSDEKGQLKPHAEVQQAIAWWFKTWQPNLDDAKAITRAADFMKAMPVWAN